MNRKILCILLGATIGWTLTAQAQIAHRREAPIRDDRRTAPEGVQGSSMDPKLAYTERRRVGLLRNGIDRCPDVPHWDSQSLLDLAVARAEVTGKKRDEGQQYSRPRNDAAKAADIALLRQMGFARFCVYTTTVDPLPPFPQPSDLVEALPDRMALSAAAGPNPPLGALGERISATLADHFREQTLGYVEGERLRLRGVPRPRVRLVFVDTQPTGEGVPPKPGRSWHGYTMAHLADQLSCKDLKPCPIEFATRLALCYDRFNQETPLPPEECESGQGGHLGLPSDLAAALVAEVLDWRSRPDRPEHLILNLSLGWDGELFHDLDAWHVSQFEPSVRAVYDALRFARRRGALVIAAAGNHRGGLEESDHPLLPAAWELKRPSWFPFFFGRKRVYAVGGVDWQGLPLPNSRTGGMPRRAAFGDHAVARVVSPEEAVEKPTAMYTGTSVSTAVASSVAAVVWHLRPELKPRQVMRLIGRSGDELPVRADCYAWKKLWPLSHLKKPPHTRRLSLCPAVKRACPPGGVACPDLESSSSCEPWEPTKPAPLTDVLATFSATLLDFAPESIPPICVRAPLPDFLIVAGRGMPPVPGCSSAVIPDVGSQRWVFPQPPDDPCPGCTLIPPSPGGDSDILHTGKEGYALAREIVPPWQALARSTPSPVPAAEIVSGALEIACYEGGDMKTRTTYEIPTENLLGDGPLLLAGIHKETPLTGCTALLNFVLEEVDGKRHSVQNPVYVDP
jgi:hypothetical protein